MIASTAKNDVTGDDIVCKDGRPMPEGLEPAKYCGGGPYRFGPSSWKFAEELNQ